MTLSSNKAYSINSIIKILNLTKEKHSLLYALQECGCGEREVIYRSFSSKGKTIFNSAKFELWPGSRKLSEEVAYIVEGRAELYQEDSFNGFPIFNPIRVLKSGDMFGDDIIIKLVPY